MELDTPRNHTAEVLYTIITNKEVSLKDFPFLAGYRTRLSELRSKLPYSALIRELNTGVSKYGNPFKYAVYTLNEFHEITAIKIYKEINQ